MAYINAELAIKALEVGKAKAEALKEPSCLSIVDEGANLVAFVRTDNAAHGTIDIAHNKAYTSSAFRVRTAELAPLSQPGQELYGIWNCGGARPYVVFGGGVPIMDGSNCLGAVGVSGGPVEADVVIAEAMADFL